MLIKFSLLIGAILCSQMVVARAQDAVFRLRCDWAYLINNDGSRSGTSGSSMFTVDPPAGQVKKEGLGAIFTAKITDDEIDGSTVPFEIEGTAYRERVIINRFTGSVENYVLIGSGGRIHYGKCLKFNGR